MQLRDDEELAEAVAEGDVFETIDEAGKASYMCLGLQSPPHEASLLPLSRRWVAGRLWREPFCKLSFLYHDFSSFMGNLKQSQEECYSWKMGRVSQESGGS